MLLCPVLQFSLWLLWCCWYMKNQWTVYLTNAHLLNTCYTRKLKNAIWEKKGKFLGKMAYWHLPMLVWGDHRCFLTFPGFSCLFVVYHCRRGSACTRAERRQRDQAGQREQVSRARRPWQACCCWVSVGPANSQRSSVLTSVFQKFPQSFGLLACKPVNLLPFSLLKGPACC